jgi:hypothetical protein
MRTQRERWKIIIFTPIYKDNLTYIQPADGLNTAEIKEEEYL